MGQRMPFEEPLAGDGVCAAAAARRVSSFWRLLGWILGPVALGALVGLLAPMGADGVPAPLARLSVVLGWAYFFAWSVSFYPQVVQNFVRRSVVGLSLDYQMLNLAGFACYFIFNGALYWSPLVQQEYRDSHGGQESAVRLNDVVFAGHATVVTAVTLAQIAAFYDYPRLRGADRALRGAVAASLVALALAGAGFGLAIAATAEAVASWLTYVLMLSEVKVLISVVKYCPQVWMNYRRQSTDGWSIANVLLDFIGGSLSVAQLVLDGWSRNDWSAVTGDPAKLLLGNLSMLFDVVFMVQHFCLYPSRARQVFAPSLA